MESGRRETGSGIEVRGQRSDRPPTSDLFILSPDVRQLRYALKSPRHMQVQRHMQTHRMNVPRMNVPSKSSR